MTRRVDMATPSYKAKGIETMLDESAKQMFGRTRTESIRDDVCVMCGKDAKEFDTDDSRLEYSISGMCQKCQNDVYNS